MNKRKYSLFLILLFLMAIPFQRCAHTKEKKQKSYTILGLGDSITEGNGRNKCYLFPLWEKLKLTGYKVDFVGPNEHKCNVGSLNHAGYGGKNAEFLDLVIDDIYKEYPADIVLIHAGHNHFVEEKPVEGIIAAHKSIVKKITTINPDVNILIAQVITAGKLPKYSYIEELNEQLLLVVKELSQEGFPVRVVNQAEGFDWSKDCLADKVHPNLGGAQKMADKWFDALTDILEKPVQSKNNDKTIHKKEKE